MKIIFSDN